jgi:IS605 OrfB family transposase
MELCRTARLKLTTTSEHDELFAETSTQFQQAKQYCIDTSWDAGPRASDKITTKTTLDDLTYDQVTSETELQTGLVQIARDEAISDITSAKELMQNSDSNQDVSKPVASSPVVVYDKRSLSFLEQDDRLVASVATTDGRVRPSVVISDDPESPQQKYFCSEDWRWTQAVLVKKNGAYFLHVTCKKQVDATDMLETGNGTVLGVDLNVTGPFVVTSTGKFIGSADELNHERNEYEKHRGDMQQVGTRSAHLAMSSVGSRFAKWSEHWLHEKANALITEAKTQNVDGIVFEVLDHIRDRISNAKKFQQWAFARFIEIVSYKSEEAEIWIDTVPAHYTSQECSECGHTSRSNLSDKRFCCVSCSQEAHRDYDAAKMIAKKYVRLHAGRTSQGGGADCQPALKSGLIPVDADAVFAVAWDSKDTDKPHPQQSELTMWASD